MTARLLAWLTHFGFGPLVLVGLALGLIAGVLRPARVGQLLTRIVVFLLLAPFGLAIIWDLGRASISLAPWWVMAIVAPVALLVVLRRILTLLLGRGAAEHAVGRMATDTIYAFGRAMRTAARLIARAGR